MKSNFLMMSVALSAVFLSMQANAQAPTQAAPQIKGANATYAQCGGIPGQFGNAQYSDAGGGMWAYLDQNQAGGKAQFKGRDEWSVYLADDQGANVQIDLWKKTCTWSKAGASQRVYRLLNVGSVN